MTDARAVIEQAYAAFNTRDVDGALELMTEDVSWPKASEGGRVMGKVAIREYWTRQWGEFDPHVVPVEVIERNGKAEVRVHQVVKTLGGLVLFDGEVWHIHTIVGGRIQRMEMGQDEGAAPSAAFAGHGQG